MDALTQTQILPFILAVITIVGALYVMNRGSYNGLTARLDQYEKHLTARLDQSEKHLNARLDQSEKHMDARLDQSEKHLNARLDRFEKHMDARHDRFEARLNESLNGFREFGERVSGLEGAWRNLTDTLRSDSSRLSFHGAQSPEDEPQKRALPSTPPRQQRGRKAAAGTRKA